MNGWIEERKKIENGRRWGRGKVKVLMDGVTQKLYATFRF